jgi:hypothetical protein
MSLENTKVIDAAGIDEISGAAMLTITDAWDWSDETKHLLALQEKLNSYFAFIESGEIYDSYPKANGRKLIIEIIGRHPLPPRAQLFLEKARDSAAILQTDLVFQYYPGSC